MSKKVEVDLKLLIAAVAFLIIATVGSAFATYLIFGSNTNPQAMAGKDEKSTKKKDMGPVYEVGEFTLNLATSSSKQSHFIRTEIVLEVSDKRALSDLEKRQPQVRDILISLIRSRTAEQFYKDTGMELLRFEIIKEMNTLLSKGEVTNVYFIDLIVQ